VTNAFGRKEQRARAVRDVGFLPFAGQDISSFVRIRMRVRRDRVSGLELAQHHDSAGALVLVQDHQLNSFIRTGLPGFVFAQRDVGNMTSSKRIALDLQARRKAQTSSRC
jgi:hypothetical protein